MPFFLIFIIIPLTEIAVFIKAGQHIGVLNTLILCFITAILGGAIVRYQGIALFMEAQKALRRGQMPVRELFDGFCIIAAGACLITPGFVTDTIGFLLLVPPVRALLRRFLAGRMDVRAETEIFRATPDPTYDPDTIEGDFERVERKDRQSEKF